MGTKYFVPSEELIRSNLERVLLRATPFIFSEGKQWYYKANQFGQDLADKYDLPLFKVVACTSALSPLKEWTLNQRITEEFINGKEDIHFKKQVDKAKEIMKLSEGEEKLVNKILNGRKTVSFYNNILSPEDERFCTIDTHIGNSLLWKGANITPQRYELIENVIKDYCKEMYLIPSQLQSIIWLTAKEFKQ